MSKSTPAKTLKTHILKTDTCMLRCIMVCQQKKLYGLCQGTIFSLQREHTFKRKTKKSGEFCKGEW